MEEFTVTQLVFLNEGLEEDFLKYEEIVLPLLADHKGKLLYRVRPARESFIYPGESEVPYEIHIVSFETKEDYQGFKNDPQRIKQQVLIKNSVKKIILFESCA